MIEVSSRSSLYSLIERALRDDLDVIVLSYFKDDEPTLG